MQGAVPKYCHRMDTTPIQVERSVESVADVGVSNAPYCDPDGCATTAQGDNTPYHMHTHRISNVTYGSWWRGGWEGIVGKYYFAPVVHNKMPQVLQRQTILIFTDRIDFHKLVEICLSKETNDLAGLVD